MSASPIARVMSDTSKKSEWQQVCSWELIVYKDDDGDDYHDNIIHSFIHFSFI